MKEKLKKYYPMGYEYGKEWGAIAGWFAMGFIFSFAAFFEELRMAQRALYVTWYGRELMEGAIARPFVYVMKGQPMCFLPLLVYLVIMLFYHYIYYYQGSKSVYVMKRIKSKRYILKTCVSGVIISTFISIASIGILYILYFLIYMLAIPNECMPRFI